MSEFLSKHDIVSGCNIITQYPVEEFTFAWQVTNFSKVFNNVQAQFKTSTGVTTWELKLRRPSDYQIQVELWKIFEGQTLKVEFMSYLFTEKKTIEYRGEKKFGTIFDHCIIMVMDSKIMSEPIHFKNDVFNFKCSLVIHGHCISNVFENAGSMLTNFEQLSSDMRDLFEKQEHCDLTMTVGQDKIQVHKSILCARSPVFNKMIQSKMLETESKEIQISDIDFDVLKDFLVFLYSGEVPELNWKSAFQLYYAADKYEIISLRESCSHFLGLDLNVDNVCDVLKLADMHGDEKLKKCAMHYARIHSSVITSTENWQDLLRTHPRLAVETFS